MSLKRLRFELLLLLGQFYKFYKKLRRCKFFAFFLYLNHSKFQTDLQSNLYHCVKTSTFFFIFGAYFVVENALALPPQADYEACLLSATAAVAVIAALLARLLLTFSFFDMMQPPQLGVFDKCAP